MVNKTFAERRRGKKKVFLYVAPTPKANSISFFLGDFAKLWEVNISLVISVRPFDRMEQISSHWTDSYNFNILLFSENLSRKFKFQ